MSFAADVFDALLTLSLDAPAAVVIPTDIVGADPALVTAAILARQDVTVLIAVAPDTGAPGIAARAVERGCSGLVPIPFADDHLRSAVSRAARRERGGPGDQLLLDGVTIDLAGLTVTGSDGTRVQLSGAQFTCLYLLARAWPRPVRLEALATELGLTGDHDQDRARRLVARLRHHIAPATGDEDFIENVRGVGYRIRRRAERLT